MPDFDGASIKREIQQFIVIRDEVSNLNKRQSEIKKRLQEAVTEFGEEDGRGHIVLEINDESTGVKTITNQKRVSKSLDMDAAEKLLEEKNLLEECVKQVPVLDEDAIMAAYYEGKLTEQDIDTMFPAKVTYAFVI